MGGGGGKLSIGGNRLSSSVLLDAAALGMADVLRDHLELRAVVDAKPARSGAGLGEIESDAEKEYSQ